MWTKGLSLEDEENGMGVKSAGGGRGEPVLEPWTEGRGNRPPERVIMDVWAMGVMKSDISDPKRDGAVG
jgi:hypothetical protein